MNQKEVLIISITVFLTLLGWIIADWYHIANTERLPDNDPRFSKPINVEIDTEVFNELEQRQ